MKKIRRRDFLRTGLIAGGAVVIGPQMMRVFGQDLPAGSKPDIVTISGDDPLHKIVQLLETLGGIGQFVRKGQTVGILVNSPWKHPGYYTHPDVALGVAELCLEAGAKEIVCFKPVPEGYWERSANYDKYTGMIGKFRYGSERVEVDIPNGK
ncbi:MAG: twin-arginine translocation signal domain-containing protein, partial [Bacteroidales bacterium]|nr:twin-arginine translocation signal domain-containing protein [Bacteroidales bacterium]